MAKRKIVLEKAIDIMKTDDFRESVTKKSTKRAAKGYVIGRAGFAKISAVEGISVETDNSSWQEPKKRKKRKPMTEDQRKASAKRLEKARAARAEKNSDYGQSGIHLTLRNLSKDHPVHPDKVKEWIKTQKKLALTERHAVRQKVKGSIAKLSNHEGYIRTMQKYLRDGDWIDMFYGEHQEHKVRYRCVALSYYSDGPRKGEVKRDVDVYYPDMGCVYTQEMLDDDREMENV